MRAPKSVKALEDLGRVRLSRNFYLRDFLYSEIANFYGMPNVPDDPDLAIEVGTRLCEELLEPIHERFGRLAIRSAYRSCSVNRFGNEHGHNCARNESNYGGHIWDRVDTNGRKGAMACVVAPRFADYFDKTGDWQAMAWWIHDQLPYSTLFFLSAARRVQHSMACSAATAHRQLRRTERHADETGYGEPRRFACAGVRRAARVRLTESRSQSGRRAVASAVLLR